MLTLCCHPVLCLLLYVCMVRTSSEAKFCQVCSGLTFSLSRHVYSSPIPIKTSTFSSPCTLLHHILHPSTSAPSLPLAARVLIILTCTLFAEPQQFLSPFVTQFSLAVLFCSLYFSIPYEMQFNAASLLTACGNTGHWVGGNESIFAIALFHFFPLIISICTDLQHWLLNRVKICIQVLFFFFFSPNPSQAWTMCGCTLCANAYYMYP